MTWKEFKKDAEAMDNKPCKDLGICEVKFGCVRGKPYLEIVPITSRVKSEDGLSGILLNMDFTGHDETYENEIKKAIMELTDNALGINDAKNFKKELEELLQKRKKKANAILDLGIT